MIRWWDDPDAARIVLAAVDDSDVVQGVGTASLGLHALAKAALTPLLGATLVDRVDVAAVLEHLPLEPVSKALAEATRPLLSEAADRYGVLLATELSHQARDGASAMVQALTARGLPMPLAVARAAEVAGLPPNRIGPYVEAMKDPATSVLVVADAADRALMTYAAALGRAEAMPSAEVSKEVRFRERDHPRDVEGRFATKGGEIDPRLARRKKRLRLAGLAGAIPTQTEAREGSLTDLVRALRPKVAPQEAPRTRTEPDLTALAASVRAAPAEEPKAKTRTRTTHKPRAKEQQRALTEGAKVDEIIGFHPASQGAYTVLVARKPFDDLLESGEKITAASLAALGDVHHLRVDPQANVRDLQAHQIGRGETPDDTVLVEIDGDLPIFEGVDHEGFEVAGQMELGISQADMELYRSGQHKHPLVEASETVGQADTEVHPWVVRMGVQNPRLLKAQHAEYLRRSVEEQRGIIERRDAKAVDVESSKALHRTVERWSGDRQSHLVTRDEGRFATAGGSPDQLRAAATARRRKRAALAGAASLRPVAIPNEASLLELVQALRPPATTAHVAPTERPAVTAASLAELAASAKQAATKPTRTSRATKPTATPKARAKSATEEFLDRQSVLTKWTGLDQMFEGIDLHDIDNVGSVQVVDLVPHEEGYARPEVATGQLRDTLRHWLHTGTGVKEIAKRPEHLPEALAHKTDWDAGAYAPRGMPGPGGPKHTWLDQVEGGYQLKETSFDQAASAAIYSEDPAVMTAIENRDSSRPIRLETVGHNIESMSDREGVPWQEVGPGEVPIYALKASFADEGNRPTATRPPGGA